MIRLLKIELLKLFPYRTFKILFIIYLLLMGLSLAGGVNMGKSGGLTSDKVLGFPNIWNYYTLYACYFNIILGIIVIFVASNEYTYRTLRQNIIDGLTRTETVISKILLITLMAMIVTLFLLISGFIAGYLYSTPENKGMFLSHIGFAGSYFIQSFGIMSMGYLASTIFKRTGLAVIIFLIFLFPVDLIFREAIGINGDYLPVANFFLKMVPFPLDHVMSGGEEPTPAAPTVISLAVGAGYSILFMVINLSIIRKRDL